jgi:hypothetical protein
MGSASICKNRRKELRTAVMDGQCNHPLDRVTTAGNGLCPKSRFEEFSLQPEEETKQRSIWLAIFGAVFIATLFSLIG